MGLFQSKKDAVKKPVTDPMAEVANEVFDDTFREDLRNRGRLYFERVINENAALFKQDLDATVAHVNTELRQHMARQLDAQFAEISKTNTELRKHISEQLDSQFVEYTRTMKDAQSLALDALERSAKALEEQHKQLGASLEKSVANQDAVLTRALEDNSARVAGMKTAQDQAIQTLTNSVHALEEQHQQLAALLQQGIANQEKLIIDAFEQNMARIVEHYLLGALGDQYDMKAQLPSIIKQLEVNKQAIVDDMKL